MPIDATRKITIGDKTFSLNALIANPDAYLPIMQPLLRESVFVKKESESDERYLWRIFTALYTRNAAEGEHSAARGTRSRTVPIILDENCESILTALGIDIVKKCPKRSSITFKNTGHNYRINNEEVIKLAESVKRDVKFSVKHKLANKNVSFGVELEFIGKKNHTAAFENAMIKAVGADRFQNVGSYNKNSGKMWILGKDCSVKPKGAQCGCGMSGFELTSPILNLNSKKDLSELATVCDIIKTFFNGEVNSSCGTHVHMSFPVEKASDDLIVHFARSYRKSEASLFDKLVPPGRRENKARYAKTVSVRYLWNRYRKLNFGNVKKDSDNLHLEFRQLDGTLDYDKIISWVRLQKMFCEMTLESWHYTCADDAKPIQINLDDVIVTKKLGAESIESLMKMNKMIA